MSDASLPWSNEPMAPLERGTVDHLEEDTRRWREWLTVSVDSERAQGRFCGLAPRSSLHLLEIGKRRFLRVQDTDD